MAARNDTRTLNPMDQHPATSVHPNVILDAQAQSLARIERHLVTIKGWVMFGGWSSSPACSASCSSQAGWPNRAAA